MSQSILVALAVLSSIKDSSALAESLAPTPMPVVNVNPPCLDDGWCMAGPGLVIMAFLISLGMSLFSVYGRSCRSQQQVVPF